MKIKLKIIIPLVIIAIVTFFAWKPLLAMTQKIVYDLRYTDGLVGYWSFNGADMNWSTGQALDRSGNSNNGTTTNMSTTTSPVPGKVGQALKFDGVDDYVSVPDSDLWAFGSSDFSIDIQPLVG